jgi:hypothetical protein
VPFTRLTRDLRSASTTPNFAFITPNMRDDSQAPLPLHTRLQPLLAAPHHRGQLAPAAPDVERRARIDDGRVPTLSGPGLGRA